LFGKKNYKIKYAHNILYNISTMITTQKEQSFILGRLTIGQNLVVQKFGKVSVYNTYDDLINNTNKIVVPVNSVLNYNGPYSQTPPVAKLPSELSFYDQSAVYSFTYKNKPALIPQSNLYTMLQINAFRIIINTLF